MDRKTKLQLGWKKNWQGKHRRDSLQGGQMMVVVIKGVVRVQWHVEWMFLGDIG